MEPLRLQLTDLPLLAPEITIVLATIVISLLDLLLPKQVNRSLMGWLSIAGLAVSAGFTMFYLDYGTTHNLLNYSYRIDDFAGIVKLVLLVGAALIILMSIGSVKEEQIPHVGEYYYLILPAVLGGMIMASSGDLITLFVGLELLSITSYILAAMRKKHLNSNEGAFKYVVLGGMSTAVLLYGMSFLYGMTGTTAINAISQSLGSNTDTFLPLMYVSFFLVLAGFSFKVAAAPFHMWAPDVYQGSSTPVTAFLATVSKAAALAVMFRVMYGVYGNPQWMDPMFYEDVQLGLMIVAAAAMIVGNTVALRQTNMKRLLAYSGVANAGYLMVPIAVQFGYAHFSNFSEFSFYLIAYMFMNIGIFAALMMVERSTGSEEVSAFAGLYHKAPWTAAGVVLLVLSLAGLPISGGFFGKLFIMLGAIQMKHYWLAAVLIITSVISFYYYFGIIRQMFMRAGDESQPIKAPIPLLVTMWICVAASVLLGLFPHVVLGWMEQFFSITSDLFMFD